MIGQNCLFLTDEIYLIFYAKIKHFLKILDLKSARLIIIIMYHNNLDSIS